MENKDREILLKILKHIHHAINYSSKHNSLESFEADDMCVEATVFNLMQIGELSKTSLSDELKNNIKSIPWKQIYGLRNRIVHWYDDVNMTIVWETIQHDLPKLEKEINSFLTK